MQKPTRRPKLLLLLTLCVNLAHSQELPDNPQPQSTPRAFAFQPARTNRQTLASPWFILPHAAAFGSAVLEKNRCQFSANGAKAGGWSDALVPVAIVTGLDYMLDRWVWRGVSLGASGYIITKDTYGAVTKQYQ
jgi:hypothetical protein